MTIGGSCAGEDVEAGVRCERLGESELRIQLGHDSLGDDQRREQEREVTRNPEAVSTGDVKDFADCTSQRHLPHAPAGVAAEKRRHVLAQASSIDYSGRGAEREQSVCQPSWVAAKKPAQKAAELLARAVVQIRPTIPKSTILTRPVVSMKKLPGCGSAWKNPSSKIIFAVMSAVRSASAW